MSTQPSMSQALEAYLGIGTRELPWPGKDDDRLARFVGPGWRDWKARLDGVLARLLDLPDAWRHEPLERLAALAAARARELHPEFSAELCTEIGSLFSYLWK